MHCKPLFYYMHGSAVFLLIICFGFCYQECTEEIFLILNPKILFCSCLLSYSCLYVLFAVLPYYNMVNKDEYVL